MKTSLVPLQFATLVNKFTKDQTGRDGRYIITLLLSKIELGVSHKIRYELGWFLLGTVAYFLIFLINYKEIDENCC